VTHSGGSDACFTNDGKSFRQKFVERYTLESLPFILVGRVADDAFDFRNR
jgi:hypothetical protein